MNELVKITEHNGKKAVSARELYDLLVLPSQHWARWYNRYIIKNEYAIKGTDWEYTTPPQVGEQFSLTSRAPKTQDFVLSIDFAKRLSMMTRSEMGEKIRQYFIEVEKQYQAIAIKPLSSLDLMELSLKALREQQAEISEIKEDVKVLQAKVQTRPDYWTVMGWAISNNLTVGRDLATSYGKRAAKVCRDNGYPIDQIGDARYGRVGSYPGFVLRSVIGN